MQLHALRPKQGANLTQLRSLIEGRDWQSALPTSLPDTVLLRLARDFRCVEAGFSPGRAPADDDAPSLAAAMYVVMNFLLGHPSRSGSQGELEISEVGLMRALQVYQVGLEREIVSRITGLTSSQPSEILAEELLRCADERDD